MTNTIRASFDGLLACTLAIALAGCGTTRLSANLDRVALEGPKKFEVGEIRNSTGKTYDIDVTSMFAASLSKALTEEGLLWSGGDERLVITGDILDYERGNAFKRWLLPGWGSTVLHVRCEVKRAPESALAAPATASGLPQVAVNPSGLGSLEARRTVSLGGAYSIGAWRTIFDAVSNDVADEIRKKVSR